MTPWPAIGRKAEAKLTLLLAISIAVLLSLILWNLPGYLEGVW